jgi:hypothetical protein
VGLPNFIFRPQNYSGSKLGPLEQVQFMGGENEFRKSAVQANCDGLANKHRREAHIFDFWQAGGQLAINLPHVLRLTCLTQHWRSRGARPWGTNNPLTPQLFSARVGRANAVTWNVGAILDGPRRIVNMVQFINCSPLPR